MEPDERPIEELIGWEWFNGSPYGRRGWHVVSDDGWVWKGARAEVGDLMEWLLDYHVHEIRVDAPYLDRHGAPRWLVVCSGTYDEQFGVGETLLDAVTDAVRAVANEEF